jgi:hypothetical protein
MPSPDPPTLPPTDPDATRAPDTGGAAGADLPPVFGRYRVQRKLGQGGMGAVFLAHDTQLDRPVALKVPFLSVGETALARFFREAKAAAALRHPNICPIYDLGQIDGTPYLSLAFIRGEPLARQVGPGRPLPPHRAAAVVRTVALALHEAHRQGVIHRDLKPANIMIDEGGAPVVMDFGLARREDALATQLTQQGQALGTPAYMSPEQFAGDLKLIGPPTDVYSLGVVLFELLTGTLPFTGDLVALASQVAFDSPPVPSALRPEIDPRLGAVALKALAKQPADRFTSMQEFADALAPFAAARGPVLTLRVAGTAFAYRPRPGQDVIRVGRQKRRPGDPPDAGNDFVLRVAGDDELSARISRQHFEVRRSGGAHFVVDLSKVGTLRNEVPIPKGEPVELRAGDRLTVAGVVTLVVLLEESPAPVAVQQQVAVPAPGRAAVPVVLEATLGDMVTMDE